MITRMRLSACIFAVALGTAAPAGAQPAWVKSGGEPRGGHLTGFGAGGGPRALETAKTQAAADLARKLRVRISSGFRTSRRATLGVTEYDVSSSASATTDLEIGGLDYEAWTGPGKAYALALLEKKAGRLRALKRRDAALADAEARLAQADVARRAGQNAEMLRALVAARAPIVEAMDQEAVASLLDETAEADPAAGRAAAAERALEAGMREAVRTPARTLDEAIEQLALQLGAQGLGTRARLLVAPLGPWGAGFASPFGQAVAERLEHRLAAGGPGTLAGDVVARGTHAADDAQVRLALVVRTRSGRAVASAEALLPRDAVPPTLPLEPQNGNRARMDEKLLEPRPPAEGGLSVDLTSSRGPSGIVLRSGQRYRLLVRTNRPAWVRLVYHLADGKHVVMEQAWRSAGGPAAPYPVELEAAPPFGVELISAVAFSDKPAALPTRRVRVAGEDYDLVDAVEDALRHRVEPPAGETAEALFTLTTLRK